MMKAVRIVYYAVMGACLLGGMINGLRVYYVVFIIQLFLCLFSLILSLWTALSFSYLQELEADRGVKGGMLRLRISIHNDKPFPFTAMRMHVAAIDPAGHHDEVFSLMPHSSVDFHYDINLAYRGTYEVGITTLVITDVFGLLSIPFDMRRLSYYRMRSILIYPRVIDLQHGGDARTEARYFAAQHLIAARSGDSMFAPRAYRPGDTARRIHWKVSARRHELFAKQYETPIRSAAVIALDNAAGELVYADTACECAAALAAYMLRHGHAVTLIDASGRPMDVSDRHEMSRLLEKLARLAFGAGGDISCAVAAAQSRVGSHAAVYAITSGVSPALHDRLSSVASGGARTVLILVDAPTSGDCETFGDTTVCRIDSGEDIRQKLSEALT